MTPSEENDFIDELESVFPKPVYWLSDPPEKCDICAKPISTSFVDGKTKMGPWGCMCPSCHKAFGYRLGIGLGQQYQLADDKWLKTEG